jgi:predicted nucleic acid-binding protein
VNALVVDTSVWVDYLEGRPVDLLDLALKEARVWLPPVVLSELLSAKLSATDRQGLQEMLAELPVCFCPFQNWVKVGELRALCAKKGLKVSTPDAHIAQCTLDLDAYLSSQDEIFKKVAAVVPLRLAGV